MGIGILVHGRFGRALGALLLEAGHGYRAWDPIAEIPAEHRVAGPRDLIDGSEVLVLAMPVPALSGVLVGLRPMLRPDHLVIGSWDTLAKPTLPETLVTLALTRAPLIVPGM